MSLNGQGDVATGLIRSERLRRALAYTSRRTHYDTFGELSRDVASVIPKSPPPSRFRCHLLVDVDDTLWENNVHFERAVDGFLAFLDHSSLSPPEVRAVLDEIERANLKVHGYGAAGFARNLRQCYEHLAERDISDDDLARVMGFGERILHEPIELIAGVAETLAYLAPRHDLVLLTKGHPEEQRLKRHQTR